VRAFRRTRPNFMLEPTGAEYPMLHLFDEPQFNTQDGYIGFMLDFFRRLRGEGRLVFLCLHPTAPFHIDILRETCERFVFVSRGRLTHAASWEEAVRQDAVRAYLGALAPR
jgi:energy-coupling factor transporter ATP-binding protein EcfA2